MINGDYNSAIKFFYEKLTKCFVIFRWILINNQALNLLRIIFVAHNKIPFMYNRQIFILSLPFLFLLLLFIPFLLKKINSIVKIKRFVSTFECVHKIKKKIFRKRMTIKWIESKKAKKKSTAKYHSSKRLRLFDVYF